MKHSITAKLILSYLVIALTVVLVVSAVIGLTSGRSLMDLLVEQQTALLTQQVQEYYAANGTLEGFVNEIALNPPPAGSAPQPNGQGAKPKEFEDFRGLGLVDSENRAVIPTFGYDIGQTIPADRIKGAEAVEVDGKTVAWIVRDTRSQFQLNPEEKLFVNRTVIAVAAAAAVGILAAVGMGTLLARNITKPIRNLTEVSQSMAAGNLGQQVEVTSDDELGLLTSTFNKMNADLMNADQQRKRLTADITHDLSTPLQNIAGYVEMFEDQVVEVTPHRLEIIKTELEHLRRLVGDLTTLTQAEAGGLNMHIQPVQPQFLLESIFQTYQPITAGAGVRLELDIPEILPSIQADEARMLQVLKNLLDNALRYTQAGGRITLSAEANGDIRLKVSDTGSGIDPEDLPYIFERFYRADKTRESSSGKMGLGLAICKALVTAQGGKIWADSAGTGRGTCMTISFPGGNPDSPN